MSQIYSTEPPTTGRVVLQTSHGPVDINLWCKECPTTTRLFVQLCVDGFYDGVIFHRILNDFLIQCGSDRKDDKQHNTKEEEKEEKKIQTYINGQKGGCVPMNKTKLEISPRIRFNHRGQVALALPLDSDVSSDGTVSGEFASLARQFFITLDEAPFLNAKHVIFGTVTGATIFNAMRIGKTDTADSEAGMPTDLENAPVIKSIKVDFHPFDDIVQTRMEDVPWKNRGSGEQGGGSNIEKRRKKRKGKRDLNVLSFGGEIEEGDEEGFGIAAGIHSSHDVIGKQGEQKGTNNKDQGQFEKRKKTKEGNEDGFNRKERKDEKLIHLKPGTDSAKEKIEPPASKSIVSKPNTNSTDTNNRPSNNVSNHSSPSDLSNIKIDNNTLVEKPRPTKKLSAIELRRSKYLVRGKNNPTLTKGSKKRDEITMSKLSSFSSKMFQVKGNKDSKVSGTKTKDLFQEDNSLATRMARRDKLQNDVDKNSSPASKAYSGQVLEHDENAEVDGSWLRAKFKCKKNSDTGDNAVGGDGRNMNDYDVVDGRGHKDDYNGKRRRVNHHSRDSKHHHRNKTKR